MKRQSGSIRKNFITLNLIFIFCSLLVIVLASLIFIMPKYYSYELNEAAQRVEQLNNLIDLELEHLDLYCRDWALWTDTWRFIQDGNPEYRKVNLGASSLEIGGLSFFIFFNSDGELIHASWIEPETGVFSDSSDLELPSSLDQLLFTGKEEMEELSEIGIIGDLRGERAYLFSAHNILRSDATGPAAGTLLAGRILDKDLLFELGKTLQMVIDLRFENTIAGEPLITPQNISYELKKTSFLSREYWKVSLPLELRLPEGSIYLNFEHQSDILYEGIRTVFMINIIYALIFILLHGFYQSWVSRTILQPILKLTDYVEQKAITFKTDNEFSVGKLNEIEQLSMRFYFLLGKLSKQNLNLSIQAQTDALTGLDRRGPVLEKLDAACSRYNTDGPETVSVIMIDIDNFKLINDTWGHPVGDEVIKGMAPVFRSCIRDGDTVGRYGGEEFIIMLKDLTSEIILVLAERIRARVEQSEWSFGKTVTVSIGYSIKRCPCKPSELIKEADRFLYAAKHGGRNRVEGGSLL